jgi:uncharacterized protein (TIGR03066 family)
MKARAPIFGGLAILALIVAGTSWVNFYRTEDKDNAKKIIGEWQDAGVHVITYEFRQDGSYKNTTRTNDGFTLNTVAGTYSVTGNTITVMVDDMKQTVTLTKLTENELEFQIGSDINRLNA